MKKFVLKSGAYWFSIVLAVGLLASGLLAIAAGVPVQKIEVESGRSEKISGRRKNISYFMADISFVENCKLGVYAATSDVRLGVGSDLHRQFLHGLPCAGWPWENHRAGR